MSNTEDFLYTNKFTNKDVPKIDYTDREKERKKAQFSDYYKGKYGMPLNLLDDSDVNSRYSIQDIINTNGYSGGGYGGGGGGGTLRYQKIRKKIIAIDSRDRDTNIYANPNKYRVFFGEKFVNIKSVRLVSTEFPNTEQVIRSQPPTKKNNKIYWKNEVDGNDIDDPRTTYSITITDGNYSSSRFANELRTKMNAVQRSTKAPTASIGKLHDFTVSVNTTTNIFEISQNDSFTLSNPFTVTQGSGTINVNHNEHGFSSGQIINISDSSKVGGIPFNLINTSHIINVPTGLVDFIQADNAGNTIIRTGLTDNSVTFSGKVSTTLNSRIVNGYGTNFLSNSNLSNGIAIHIGNHAYNIKTIQSDTQLTLFQPSLEDLNGTFIIDSIKKESNNDLIIRSKKHGLVSPIGSSTYPKTTIVITGTKSLNTVYDGTNSLIFDYDGSYILKSILNDDEFTIEGTSNNDPNEIVYTKNTNETGKYTYTIQTSASSSPVGSDEYLAKNFYLSKMITGKVSTILGSSSVTGSKTRYEQTIFEAPTFFRNANAFSSAEILTGNITKTTSKFKSISINQLFITDEAHGNPKYDSAGKSVQSPPNEIIYKLKFKDIVIPSYSTTSGNEIVSRLFFCTAPNYSVTDTSLEFESPVIKIEENKIYKFDLSDPSFKDKNIYFSDSFEGTLNGNNPYLHGITESADSIENINIQPGTPNSFKKISVDYLTADKLYYNIESRGLITGFEADGPNHTKVYTQYDHGLLGVNNYNSPYVYLTNINNQKNSTGDLSLLDSSFTISSSNCIRINSPLSNHENLVYWNFKHNGFKDYTGTNQVEKSHLKKVSIDNSYLGTANYGFNSVNLSASNETLFLNGNVINIMSDGSNSWNGVGKATFWAPNHSLSTNSNKIAIFNSRISTVSSTEYYARQGTNSTLGNMYASNITSINVGGIGNDANDITINVTNNLNGTGGAHMISNDNDFIIIKGFGDNAYDYLNGLYRANRIDTNNFKIRKSGFNQINANYPVSTNAVNIRFYGIGYNGEYDIDSVTNDTFTINYPYMGSENANWSEIITANSGYRVYPNGNSSISVLSTNFQSLERGFITEDNILIGNDQNALANRIVQSIETNNSLTLDANATATLNDVIAYKNLTDSNLASNDNLSFSNNDVTININNLDKFNITRVNSFQFTINTVIDEFKTGIINYPGSIISSFNFNGSRRWNNIVNWNHNSKYNITVNRTATETVTTGRGGDAVKIGIPVRFSLQFSYTDTPGKLLGFPNVGERYKGFTDNTTGMQRYFGDTEYNSVQSNTIKTDIVNIIKTEPNTVLLTKVTTNGNHGFETGDKIFIEGHTGTSNDLAINDDGGHVIDRPDSLNEFLISIPLTGIGGGANGIVYRKQLFKPYSLSGENYVYLKIPTLSSISSTSTNVSSIFAKILLDASPGSILFNSYVSSDKVFEDVPLNELDHLDIEIVDPQGELFEFNNIDHSFSLEITSYVDIVRGSGVSSRTGQTDET